MDIILLEKAKIAIYTPPNKQPWDDAVTLALTYAEVDYETLWDAEVHLGKLSDYDWLHLHHEDFTGQHGKFYRSHRNSKWYKNQKMQFQDLASKLGYPVFMNIKKPYKKNKKLCKRWRISFCNVFSNRFIRYCIGDGQSRWS